MSYAGISIREAIEKMNNISNGWFLPQIQRQYVWGARYESESYICLLLDSLFRRFPIGGLVVWETKAKIAFREFVNDYAPGKFAKQVDEGRWGHDKGLVYDGQQRLQTLRSVLLYTFNDRVLCFDLLFDRDSYSADKTGFLFVNRDDEIPEYHIRMTELIGLSCDSKTKVMLEKKYSDNQRDDDHKLLVKANISALWDVFVDRNIKSIAYFPVVSDNEEEVNEIFRRLNIGGVTLTQIELVLAKIKAKYPGYEESLWETSAEIAKCTGGFVFTSAEILQFIFLLVFGSIKVDVNRIKDEHLELFNTHILQAKDALRELFEGYLWDLMKINRGEIIDRRQALSPIAVYLVNLKYNGHNFRIKRFSESNIQAIHQYFILSQFCDWNTQTMVNAFAEKAMEAGKIGLEFPINAMKDIAVRNNRSIDLSYNQFVSRVWLALKILLPNRQYVFYDVTPQIDHIFPLELAGMDNDYKEKVNILWNFQPMPAGVNNYKRAKHPQVFFESSDGKKYYGAYDFLPSLKSDYWDDYKKFLWRRHLKMRKELKKIYGIEIKRYRPRAVEV
ncbi:MAG: DUF262 domain-containing protein [Spirochaetota bacterium]